MDEGAASMKSIKSMPFSPGQDPTQTAWTAAASIRPTQSMPSVSVRVRSAPFYNSTGSPLRLADTMAPVMNLMISTLSSMGMGVSPVLKKPEIFLSSSR